MLSNKGTVLNSRQSDQILLQSAWQAVPVVAHLGSNVAAVPWAALLVQQLIHEAAGQAPRGVPVRVCLRACSQETQHCKE